MVTEAVNRAPTAAAFMGLADCGTQPQCDCDTDGDVIKVKAQTGDGDRVEPLTGVWLPGSFEAGPVDLVSRRKEFSEARIACNFVPCTLFFS